jgi:Putative adhesin
MSRTMQLAVVVLAFAGFSGLCKADECEFSAERKAQADTQGVKRVEIKARAGSLRIEGRNGATVEGSGMACASSEKLLAGIVLETRKQGDTLLLEVKMPDRESMELEDRFGSVYASLDLTALVPDSVPLVVTDSSGDAQITRVAALDVTDSSGDLRIRDVPGDVRVRDSSGELSLRNIGGNLNLSDSSGDVRVSDVAGRVEVEVDSSGDLDIERVKRDVHVLQDSSGTIMIADVDGSVRIDHDGSGDVDVRRVKGKFTLGSKGSGDVREAEIGGGVEITR